MMSNITHFYSHGEDYTGEDFPYSLKQIREFSDEDLEATHNYIQWIFPTNEPSEYNPEAPLLTEDDVHEFHNSGMMLELLESVRQYMGFLKRNLGWRKGFDHNHLRITRMLKCLMLMGLVEEAEAVLSELAIHHRRSGLAISTKSWKFWRAAVFGEEQ